MLSPITAGLLALAVGSAVLLAQPSGPLGTDDPPAAEVDPGQAAIITGEVIWKGVDGEARVSSSEGFWLHRGYTYTTTWATTDPRLDGTATYTGNWMQSQTDGWQVEAADLVLVNDAGRWVGSGTALGGDGFEATLTLVLQGEGAYEGLSAYVLTFGQGRKPARTFNELRAVILPGEMPQPPASEAAG